MKKSNVESITVSLLRMTRACLMTQTEMSEALKLEFMPDTVNDDLDAFVEKLRFGNASEEEIFTYHFYELSEAENTPVQNDASWTILDDLKYLETVQNCLLNSSTSGKTCYSAPLRSNWPKFVVGDQHFSLKISQF